MILYLSAFSKKVRTINFFLLDFSISGHRKSFRENNQTNLFSILSLLGVILQRLCSRQVPHVGSIQGAYFLGFPTFVRRRRKNSPNLSSPSPNVRRDKISRSGKPLTLIKTIISILHVWVQGSQVLDSYRKARNSRI